MADLQVGNRTGLTAVGGGKLNALLATVTADGVNTVTVDSPRKLYAGMAVDIVHKTTGVVLATNRTITDITSAGVVTYSGADVTATTSHGLFPVGGFTGSSKSNVNGGAADQAGYTNPDLASISSMRARLTAISSGYYTAARLNTMTYNDMVYAIRLNDNVASIK